MTEETRKAWNDFGNAGCAMPILDFVSLRDQHEVLEHIKFSVPISKHRARILDKLSNAESDVEMVINTRFVIDALWKLFWRKSARFLFKKAYAGSTNTDRSRG